MDSFLVPRYSQQEAVTFNVSSAFWTADDLNLLLRVTVEDVFGGTLPADAFFEQMDCSGTYSGRGEQGQAGCKCHLVKSFLELILSGDIKATLLILSGIIWQRLLWDDNAT